MLSCMNLTKQHPSSGLTETNPMGISTTLPDNMKLKCQDYFHGHGKGFHTQSTSST